MNRIPDIEIALFLSKRKRIESFCFLSPSPPTCRERIRSLFTPSLLKINFGYCKSISFHLNGNRNIFEIKQNHLFAKNKLERSSLFIGSPSPLVLNSFVLFIRFILDFKSQSTQLRHFIGSIGSFTL